MDWITGVQKAIDYIEEHLTEPIDYEQVAREAFSSSYHFQRMFSILCGCTLGEYIRSRRLSLAGVELQATNAKVIDVALKYGYESPDSFAKAFQRFHGLTPSQARAKGTNLKSFSRLNIKVTLEGGSMMDYRIEDKEAFVLTGYKKRFSGDPLEHMEQEKQFYITTRVNQALLYYLGHDCDTGYNVVTNFSDDGYDYYIAGKISDWSWEQNCDLELKQMVHERFERIFIPAGRYLVCETERSRYPVLETDALRRKAVTEWLPAHGYELAAAPEVNIFHWFFRDGDEALNNSRYAELWLPIKKKV